MYGLVSSDEALFVESGTSCMMIALAIGLGFVVVAVANRLMVHRPTTNS
jgi:uncharacterized membrane protein YjjB (DUF3815 family)